MEHTIKKVITGLLAMLCGSASGCVMDAQERNLSYHDDNYAACSQTSLIEAEAPEHKTMKNPFFSRPNHFLNLRSKSKCNIDQSNCGCGGCVTL